MSTGTMKSELKRKTNFVHILENLTIFFVISLMPFRHSIYLFCTVLSLRDTYINTVLFILGLDLACWVPYLSELGTNSWRLE